MSRLASMTLLSVVLVGASSPTALADDTVCIGAVEQSLTLRQKGQLHEALRALAVCADAACPAEVREECVHRIDSIALAMPTLVLAAKDGEGNDLNDVQVTMDGTLLAASLDGRPMAIDPGEHVFLFEARGQPALERTFIVREGEKDRRESIVLGPAPAAPPPPSPSPTPSPLRAAWSTHKSLALASGGLGVAGLSLGFVLGAFASSAQSQEKTHCGTAACPNPPQANEDYDVARKDATASTVAVSAGAAFVVTAAILWLTAPPTRSTAGHGTAPAVAVAPLVWPSGGAVLLGGAL